MQIESTEPCRARPRPANAPQATASDLRREEAVQIYTAYAASLFNYFFYSLGNKESAEDLTGDVFVKALGKGALYDERKGGRKSWLFAIARNTLRDHLKSLRRAPRALTLDEAAEMRDADTGPETYAVSREAAHALTRAMESLNERERHILALKYGAGLRNKDIAKLSSLTEKHVAVIIGRALTKLRAELGEDWNV